MILYRQRIFSESKAEKYGRTAANTGSVLALAGGTAALGGHLLTKRGWQKFRESGIMTDHMGKINAGQTIQKYGKKAGRAGIGLMVAGIGAHAIGKAKRKKEEREK